MASRLFYVPAKHQHRPSAATKKLFHRKGSIEKLAKQAHKELRERQRQQWWDVHNANIPDWQRNHE